MQYANQAGHSDSSRYWPRNVITEFRDGFGAWTRVKYSALGDDSVYRPDLALQSGDGEETDALVYDLNGPVFVVAAAESVADEYLPDGMPAASVGIPEPRIRYFYSGAKLQAGGRGFLGFGELASFDERSGVLTRTRYRQDFPYTGRPLETRSWFLESDPWQEAGAAPTFPEWVGQPCSNENTRTGTFLSCSRNDWASRSTDRGLPHIYLEESNEWSFAPTHAPESDVIGSELIRRVETRIENLSQFGDALDVVAITYDADGEEVSRQRSENIYHLEGDHLDRWHLGRLSCSEVTTIRGDAVETRTTWYEYDLETGILDREVVEPDECEKGTDGELVTEYEIDHVHGNRWQTRVQAAGGTERVSRIEFDSKGRFAEAQEVLLRLA
jgi:hypothetical protein